MGMEHPDLVSQLLADHHNKLRVHLGLQLPWQQGERNAAAPSKILGKVEFRSLVQYLIPPLH